MATYAYDQTLGKAVYFDSISESSINTLKTHIYTCVECGLPLYLRHGTEKGAYWAHGPYTRNSGWECKLLSKYSSSCSTTEKTKESREVILTQWYKNGHITIKEVIGAYERLLNVYKQSESKALREVAEKDLEKKKLQMQQTTEKDSQNKKIENLKQQLRFTKDISASRQRTINDYKKFFEEKILHIAKPIPSTVFKGESLAEKIPDWISLSHKEKLKILLENNITWEPGPKRHNYYSMLDPYIVPEDPFDYVRLKDLKRTKTQIQKQIANPSSKKAWSVHDRFCLFLARSSKHSDLPSEQLRAEELSLGIREGTSSLRDFYCKRFIEDVIEYLYDTIIEQKNTKI